MPSSRVKLGDFGEQAAATYLLRQGYTLLARKWRCAVGEIDLLFHDGTVLVFVEVRTRRGDHPGLAEASIGPIKQAKLVELAYTYLADADLPDSTLWRIDVVALDVDWAGKITRLQHIQNAVEEHEGRA